MKIGVLSDTHDDLAATSKAVELLVSVGAEVFIHCGDITGAEVLGLCDRLPTWFVYGNHDTDNVTALEVACQNSKLNSLAWGGTISLAGKQIGVTHGHMTLDVKPLLAARPDYLLTGHFHEPADWVENGVRRICPGALHRTESPSVAVLDLASDRLSFLSLS